MPLSQGTISDGAECAREQRADFCGKSRYVLAQFPTVVRVWEAPRLLRATLYRWRRCRCGQTQEIACRATINPGNVATRHANAPLHHRRNRDRRTLLFPG